MNSTRTTKVIQRLANQVRNGSSLAQKQALGQEVSQSQRLIDLEHQYGAHNYHPLPVVFSKGEGVHVWDPEGKKYLDFLSAYSAVNQGHCHPKIIEALIQQSQKLTLSSRAFYNDKFGEFAEYITKLLKYDMVLPMNTGAEAVETALKLARKWGYEKKGIKQGEAVIVSLADNFHGRTMGIISMSTDNTATTNFGPFLPNVGPVCPKSGKVLYMDDIQTLEEIFEANGANMAGFLMEPIQGEAGIKIPNDAFVQRAYELCKQHNVLFIGDEVQTGLARTGKMLAVEHVGVRPDIIILGKALSGGVYPVSAVLADKDVMLCIQPGEHGSTYGGNPLGSAVAMAALEVIQEEGLVENSRIMGELFRNQLKGIGSNVISEVRGRGLLNAIVVDENYTNGRSAWHLCLIMKELGLLAKPTHNNIIRLAPPLTITKQQTEQGVDIINRAIKELPNFPM
ncbi:ornithine aminotransferase car2 [Neoconidiobolus thromboides FSU 785]|nr:ornithine aminotransferase car2 [Neoconidiobolus thromboides FSU 785]